VRSRADITHFANVEDEATGTAFEMFRFTTVDGGRGEALIKREDAFDPGKVLAELRRRNADLPSENRDAQQEVHGAIAAPPRRRQRHCAATGRRADSKQIPFG
jgi:hypothetical protein